ncbi:MAG TPA: acyltransferase family protein, partial [Acidimicrobiales bacterium]|nr:acyltransferase family protein [Acidimicrobiales bacterium]
DGIRGVAIIVIMGYHGGVFLTSGGFYSLDTFFALSGFLITSLLISEWQRTTTIRLGRFWARRARRLLPALLVMLLAVAIFAAFLVPAGTYPTLRGDTFSTLFYYANWHFIANGSNYFNQTALTSPLTHTWSLAVEEQFYLVWPLVVLGLFKLWRSTRIFLVVCVVGALASAVEMGQSYSPGDVNRLYYGTDTRAQSLLVGAALAASLTLWADHRRRAGTVRPGTEPIRRRLGGDPAWAVQTLRGRAAVLAVGLAGVGVSAVLWTLVSYNDALAYRGGFLLAALATTAVLFSVVCSQRSVLAQCLSVAPLRYVGRISYGMYLWHFPLFIYLDHARTGLTGYPLFSVRVAVTLLVATGSFYVVERPIRQGNILRGWRTWAITPVAVLGTAAALVAATSVPAVAVKAPAPAPSGALDTGPQVRTLVVGDSTALTLDIGLNEHARDYGVVPFNGGILGCGVTDGAEYQEKGVDAPMAVQCRGTSPPSQWPTLWKADIAKDHPNVVMILAGRWEVSNRTYDGRWTNIDNPTYAAYVQRELKSAVQVADSTGAAVVLMTAPCYDTGEQPDGQPWPEDSRTRLDIYNGIVRRVAASVPGTSLLDFNAMACPGGQYEEFMDGQQVRLADGIHFTFTGGNVFAPRIWPFVVRIGRQQMTRTG